MIPKASQRGLGQDLATHLMNARDNERVEIAELRGAVARDLSGAFAEWQLQADTLTRCSNYLYSLSINPDPSQGPLSREAYLDYIGRAEERLGLTGQPRAVVFHVKHGRQHCHVVWSRIDAANERAVHLALDRQTLMMVTREFARDHGLSLPDGYRRRGEAADRSRQLSLYDKHQQDATGLSKEERVARVTAAWRRSDSPQAFVRALEEQGYVLATGRRPYVLVDLYGEMNALPKLIDDREVRTRDIRAFLERAYPPEDLPTVAQARALVADHRRALDAFRENEARVERRDALARKQAGRREALEAPRQQLRARQQEKHEAMQQRHAEERAVFRAAFRAEQKRIRQERAAHRPHGLAAFLGRVTGVALVIRKLHRRRDKQRLDAHRADQTALIMEQGRREEVLLRHHALQRRELDRKARALDRLDRRERRSLETAMLRERRAIERARATERGLPEALRASMREPSALDVREVFGHASSDRGSVGRGGRVGGQRRSGDRRLDRHRGGDGQER